jgi:hypothetical protein
VCYGQRGKGHIIYARNYGILENIILVNGIHRNVRQILSLYFQFYKVTMLESTNAASERKMQMYF